MMDDSLNENEGRNRKELRQTVIQLTIDRSFLTNVNYWSGLQSVIAKEFQNLVGGWKAKALRNLNERQQISKFGGRAKDFQKLDERHKRSKNLQQNHLIMPKHIIYNLRWVILFLQTKYTIFSSKYLLSFFAIFLWAPCSHEYCSYTSCKTKY